MDSSLSAASAASAVPAHLLADTADVGFPWAGAALLALLALVALVMRWRAGRGGTSRPPWMSRWAKGPTAARPGGLGLEASLRLDGQTQVHAVQWGDRRLLVATTLNASPVLLDSRPAADGETSP
ncbi:hypothetical protein [Ideonella sp. YS5]|uniref:hypothetical protein n=1 Tax=Ideonella sp. YS5 TaxID=3453714 RepID=UPI003EEF1A2B